VGVNFKYALVKYTNMLLATIKDVAGKIREAAIIQIGKAALQNLGKPRCQQSSTNNGEKPCLNVITILANIAVREAVTWRRTISNLGHITQV
jgi:hypothetical protein